uniref:Small ribosomal subunit protein uS10 domain-containing protein n=1 Tax=Oreochromis aureus TaxID=47969 RepID=A0AAZ1Y5A7_OREAU
MNPVFRKVQASVAQQALLLNKALTPCRAAPSIRHPVWCTHSVNERQYKGMPTHGIGRWKYLLPKQAPRKKKDKQQMKQIMSATDTAYGTLNVNVSGYDMTVVEHYSQYIHNFCNRLGIKVADSYALPTKSTEVMLMQEQGTKTYVDAVLKTHHRVIKVRTGLSFLVLSAQTAGAAGVMRGFKDLTANSVINFCPAEHSERRAVSRLS